MNSALRHLRALATIATHEPDSFAAEGKPFSGLAQQARAYGEVKRIAADALGGGGLIPAESPGARAFVLVRHEDATGISGRGIVAEGAVFSSGKAVLAWTTEVASVAVYDSFAELMAIHGHAGKTQAEFL